MEVDAPQPMQRSSMNQSPSAPSGWRRRGMATRPTLSPDRITVWPASAPEVPVRGAPGRSRRVSSTSCESAPVARHGAAWSSSHFSGFAMDGPAADRSELRSLPVGYSLTCWVGRRTCRRHGRRRCRRAAGSIGQRPLLLLSPPAEGVAPGDRRHPACACQRRERRRWQGLGDLHRCGRHGRRGGSATGRRSACRRCRRCAGPCLRCPNRRWRLRRW